LFSAATINTLTGASGNFTAVLRIPPATAPLNNPSQQTLSTENPLAEKRQQEINLETWIVGGVLI
jgi:hypothetical protein